MLGKLVLWEGWGDYSIWGTSEEKRAHIARGARVTRGSSSRVCKPGVSQKEGRICVWRRWADRVNCRRAGAFCGGRI